jgi:hypothetical protein
MMVFCQEKFVELRKKEFTNAVGSQVRGTCEES